MPKFVSLRTVGQVAGELGAVYRRARRGEMDWNDAASASLVLHRLRQALEVGSIEARTAALELALERGLEAQKANGHRLNSGPPPHYFRQ